MVNPAMYLMMFILVVVTTFVVLVLFALRKRSVIVMQQSVSGHGGGFHGHMAKNAPWGPIVFLGLGVVCLFFWSWGTSVQVLTSEAWYMNVPMIRMSFSAFGQIIDLFRGVLPSEDLIPVTFAWGVQLALIIASIGVELPREPAWRYWGSWIIVGTLLFVNSCGDFVSSSNFGFWQQCGFTVVIWFMTFFLGLLAIMCFKHAFHLWSK